MIFLVELFIIKYIWMALFKNCNDNNAARKNSSI